MVKRDPCWRAKKAVRQETNHLDFSFRFKDVFVSCKNAMYETCMGLYLFPKTLYVIFNIRKTLTIKVIIKLCLS